MAAEEAGKAATEHADARAVRPVPVAATGVACASLAAADASEDTALLQSKLDVLDVVLPDMPEGISSYALRVDPGPKAMYVFDQRHRRVMLHRIDRADLLEDAGEWACVRTATLH